MFNFRTLYLILSLLYISHLNAQIGLRHDHRWYFTDQFAAGLFFPNGTNPTTNFQHAIPFAPEGCITVNHPVTGNLLFYSNGQRIWDAQHQIMPNGNGLQFHASGSQKIVGLPNPQNCNQILLFHHNTAIENGAGNLYLTTVDMTLPGNGTPMAPLGDVPAGQKNLLITSLVHEGMTVVESSVPFTFYVIISRFSGQNIDVLRVDATGVNQIGSYPLPSTMQDIRSIRYTPRGHRIAIVGGREIDPLFTTTINPSTGALSPFQTIPGTPLGTLPQYWNGVYDAEFSPDGSKLYLAKYRNPATNTGGRILQYDFNNPGLPVQVVYNNMGGNNNWISGMRLGPDGRIYFVVFHPIQSNRYVGVIQNPNLAGAACNPNPLGIDFGQPLGLYAKFPEMIFPNYPPQIPPDTVFVGCDIGSISIYQPFLQAADQNFTGFTQLQIITPPSNNYSAVVQNQNIQITINSQNPPLDSLKYSLCDNHCFSLCDTGVIYLIPPSNLPTNILGPDSVYCNVQSIHLSTNIPGSYLWSTNATTPSINISQSGQYHVAITNQGCTVFDTIQITFNSTPQLVSNSPTIDCNNNPVSINVLCPNCDSLLWNSGATSSSITFSQSDSLAWVSGFNQCGSDTLPFNVTIASAPLLVIPDTLVLCSSPITLQNNASCINCIYQSNQNIISFPLSLNTPGNYSITASNICGSITETLVLLPVPNEEVQQGPILTLCPNSFAIAYLNQQGSSPVIWSNGQQDTLIVTEPGTYFASWSNACGSIQDTIEVVSLQNGLNLIPSTITKCDITPFYLSFPWLDPNSYNIFWTSGADSILVDEPGNYNYSIVYCNDTVSGSIIVDFLSRSPSLFLPNSFTPNNDGINDVFFPKGVPSDPIDYSFEIFDRWGQLIWKTDNPKGFWDGKIGVDPIPNGVYVYRVSYSSICHPETSYLGKISIIR